MIDNDLPNLVNVLNRGNANGFKIDTSFKRKRDSCSHSGSQPESARSKRASKDNELDITEFDPIYRRSDFKQVRKNVN